MFYNEEVKSWELGKPKGGKARSLKIGDTLLAELKAARKSQIERRLEYAEYYKQTYYKKIQVNGRNHIQLSCPFRYEISNNPNQYKDQTKVDFVCVKTDGDLFTPQTIKYSNKVIKKQLDMPGYHFHMLRHTHGTILIANGAKMKAVQERLGHATITVTMDIYAHVTPEMEEEAVGIFEKANNN